MHSICKRRPESAHRGVAGPTSCVELTRHPAPAQKPGDLTRGVRSDVERVSEDGPKLGAGRTQAVASRLAPFADHATESPPRVSGCRTRPAPKATPSSQSRVGAQAPSPGGGGA